MYRRRSKELISSLLRRISSVGDTYEQHKEDLDYKPFLEIQLELIEGIVSAEKIISRLRKTSKNLRKIEEARERRSLLKLLGTTIAWILLEFNRPYIRNLARGNDPGFISGKRGLKLEILGLKSAFEIKNCAAILHDITNCLRVGDLSIIGPNGISMLELKLTERKKMDRRERRQKRRGEIIREFYEKGMSTKIIPGMKSVKHILEKRDKHNWNQISAVLEEAAEKECAIRTVEDCMIYAAFRNKVSDECFRFIKREFKDPYFMIGCHDRHIFGLPSSLPSIMPFTCFEIPLLLKEKLLFGEINFCVMLDLNSLDRIMTERGFPCTILKDSKGILKVSSVTKEMVVPGTIGHGLINRLLYECLSVETIVNYIKELAENLTKEEILE